MGRGIKIPEGLPESGLLGGVRYREGAAHVL
jgi:hypothetical protein